jgi:hypothetical protein
MPCHLLGYVPLLFAGHRQVIHTWEVYNGIWCKCIGLYVLV